MKSIVLFFLITALALPGFATTWQVGPTRTYTAPSKVMPLVQNGDTVLIDPVQYIADVGVWTKDNLVIRGTGGGALLSANGVAAQGKGTWVITGNNTYIENIAFSGASVPDHNGAGIRQEGSGLTLRRCIFLHNEDGVLAGANATSDILFEACEFGFNGYGDGYSHNIYIGHVRTFTMRFCYTHDAHQGHLIKSRANANYILYNRITEEADTTSYDIDLPNGGFAVIAGNVIHKQDPAGNSVMIFVGEEGATNPDSMMYVLHNTMVGDRGNGVTFVSAKGGMRASVTNNIFAGNGAPYQGDNVFASDNSTGDKTLFHFKNPQKYEYRITARFPDMRIVDLIGTLRFHQTQQYVYDLDSAAYGNDSLTRGAFPFHDPQASVSMQNMISQSRTHPNPFHSETRISIPAECDLKTLDVRIYSEDGRNISAKYSLQAGELVIFSTGLPAGSYFYEVIQGSKVVTTGKLSVE